jgi:hypothetical protein
MDWLWFFLAGWGLPATAWTALTVVAACRLEGRLRLLAMVPVPIMAVVAVVTASLYANDSNLWPILLIFGAPLACLWTGVCLYVGRRGERAAPDAPRP